MKSRETVGPLLNDVGALLTGAAEKMEILNAFFASFFSAKTSPQASQTQLHYLQVMFPV